MAIVALGNEEAVAAVGEGMRRTCPLCLRQLGVDDVGGLDQCPAGLDHLKMREDRQHGLAFESNLKC